MARGFPLVTAVVSSDRRLHGELTTTLRAARHAVVPLAADANAIQLLREYPWDIVLVDGGRSTTELCLALREQQQFHGRFVVALVPDGDAMVQALDAGADEAMTLPVDLRELFARLHAAERIVELKKGLLLAHERLERLAVTDGLTGLYNHRYLQEQVAAARMPFAFAMIDVDHFKRVNDQYGHGVGDTVLVELSNIIVQSIRSTDILGRYGGEEFALLMPSTKPQDAIGVAARIRRAIAAHPIAIPGGRTVSVTVSAGLAFVPSASIRTAAEVVQAADAALYRAKRHGRNRVSRASAVEARP